MNSGTVAKSIMLIVGIVLGGALSASGQMLYTTQEDFTGWVGGGGAAMTASAVNTGSIGNNTTNGLGNTTTPGGAGTNGSLSEVWNSGSYNYFYGPGENGNAAFMSALGASTASIPPGLGGTIRFDYTKPPAGTGNYFQLGVVINADNNFGQFFGSETDNGNGTYTATVNYTLNAAPALNYFQLGLIYNSNYNTNTPFTIDNIRLVPEPSSLALLGLAGSGLFVVRRRRG